MIGEEEDTFSRDLLVQNGTYNRNSHGSDTLRRTSLRLETPLVHVAIAEHVVVAVTRIAVTEVTGAVVGWVRSGVRMLLWLYNRY